MKWVIKDPKRGDMIRVELGTIYHFGIYVSDDEVIQFGLAPSRRNLMQDNEIEVLSSDIYEFLAGGFLEVCEFDRKERKKNRTPDAVVDYARSKLGTKGYHIIYNNCEHFANECVSGKSICRQAEDLRALFRSLPIVDVYLAKLPEKEPSEPLSCAIRQAEIDGISNERVKREKYYVWKLLGYGLDRSLGIKIADACFTREDGGRYSCNGAQFSLSHSKDALAAVISREPVGVDIEPKDTENREALAERIMTADEFAVYEGLSAEEKQEYFIRLWTAKEALFKKSHGTQFDPASHDTGAGGFSTFDKTVGDKVYTVSVATATPEKIRFFEGIEL